MLKHSLKASSSTKNGICEQRIPELTALFKERVSRYCFIASTETEKGPA